MDMSFFDYALLGVTAFNLGAIVWAGNKLREYSAEISRQKARADMAQEATMKNLQSYLKERAKGYHIVQALEEIAIHKVSNPNGTVVMLQRKAKEALDRAGF